MPARGKQQGKGVRGGVRKPIHAPASHGHRRMWGAGEAGEGVTEGGQSTSSKAQHPLLPAQTGMHPPLRSTRTLAVADLGVQVCI